MSLPFTSHFVLSCHYSFFIYKNILVISALLFVGLAGNFIKWVVRWVLMLGHLNKATCSVESSSGFGFSPYCFGLKVVLCFTKPCVYKNSGCTGASIFVLSLTFFKPASEPNMAYSMTSLRETHLQLSSRERNTEPVLYRQGKLLLRKGFMNEL